MENDVQQMIVDLWMAGKKLVKENRELIKQNNQSCAALEEQTGREGVLIKALEDLVIQSEIVKNLNEKLKTINTENANLQTDHCILTNNYKDAIKELAEQDDDIERLSVEIDDLKREARNARAIMEGLEDELVATMGQMSVPEPLPDRSCSYNCSQVIPGTVTCLTCDAFTENPDKCTDDAPRKKCPPCPSCRPEAAKMRALQPHLPQNMLPH